MTKKEIVFDADYLDNFSFYGKEGFFSLENDDTLTLSSSYNIGEILNFTLIDSIYTQKVKSIKLSGTFSDDLYFPDLGFIRFVLVVGSKPYYYRDNYGWVCVNNPFNDFSKSNSLEEINNNLKTLPFKEKTDFNFIAIVGSNSAELPKFTKIIIEFDYVGEKPYNLDYCLVWGYLRDFTGSPLEGQKIKITLPKKKYQREDFMIIPFDKEVFTDSDGYWEIPLLNSNIIRGGAIDNTHYVFSINGALYNRLVPENVGVINFNDLDE